MIETYIIYGMVALILIVASFSGKKIYNDIRRFKMIQNFADYRVVLDYHLEKAYDLLHKDRILIYSLEATTLPDEEFNKVSKEYAQLVEKVMGPRLLQEFIFFYGDHSTLSFIMMEFFNSRYENDEVRQTALENLQSEEAE